MHLDGVEALEVQHRLEEPVAGGIAIDGGRGAGWSGTLVQGRLVKCFEAPKM
jgi:hypothetical protein